MIRYAGAAIVAALALSPLPGRALVCGNCTQEATEIFRDIKRAAEFAKQLAVVKQQAETQLRMWQALYEARSFRGITGALGRLSGAYYPDGRFAITVVQDGHAMVTGSRGVSGLDRLLSRGTISRLEQTWGGAERWYDAMERRQHLVSFGRDASDMAVLRSRESLDALTRAAEMLGLNQGTAEILAGLMAMNTAEHNTALNAQQLEGAKLRFQTEALQMQVEDEERQRMGALAHAQSYEWAFDAARAAQRGLAR